MRYIEKNLTKGESIIYRTKLHWIVFIWPIFWIFIAVLLFSIGNKMIPVGGFFSVVAIATCFAAFINYSTSDFGVTNKRVLMKSGFIRININEIFLTKVDNIFVKQGRLGRFLGYGSVIVSGTGGTKNPFHKITNPLEFKRITQEQSVKIQEKT